MVDGIWERMKACKADDCRWAFLDTSKNSTRAVVLDGIAAGNRARCTLPAASIPAAPAPTVSAQSTDMFASRTGWAPTVQLTAYLRGEPADGWLRVVCTTTQIGQTWFDADHTVVDSAGRVVVQTRQLAMVPPP